MIKTHKKGRPMYWMEQHMLNMKVMLFKIMSHKMNISQGTTRFIFIPYKYNKVCITLLANLLLAQITKI